MTKARVRKTPSRAPEQLQRRRFLQSSMLVGTGCMTSLTSMAQDPRLASASSVVTTANGKVRGLRYADGVQAFYGVPYAADTGGLNRFSAPKPAANWDGIRQCTEIGLRCPQTLGGPLPEVFALDRAEAMGEDCLRINVFTPAGDTGKRPVMVWLHGGGYTSGSGGWLLYDGSNLAATADVVVVTVNHRLNVFGHLYLKDLAGDDFADSGNAGMLDIIEVLRWVKTNIAGFGGDAANVTLFGQSGGAGKVSTLMGMPAAKGLFHKAIAMSGSAMTGISPDAATQTAERMLAALDINKSNAASLRNVPARQLLDAFLSTAGLNFGPVVDGSNLPANPFTPQASALSRDIPLLMGTTEHEVNFLPGTPLEPLTDEQFFSMLKAQLRADDARTNEIIKLFRSNRPHAENVELYQIIASDLSFRRGVIAQVEAKAEQHGAPVYLYYFTWRSPVRDGKLGAYHCLDIPFAFNNVDVCAAMVGSGQDRYALASAMSTAFASFARTGNPNHKGLPQWQTFDTKTRATMIMNNEPELMNDPYGAERKALYQA